MLAQAIPAEAPPAEALEGWMERFHRDGYLLLSGLLAPEDVAAMKEKIDRAFADEHLTQTDNRYGDFIMCRMFELDPFFQDLLVREPFIGIAEHVLGQDCHLIAQNCVRNKPGQALDRFHADESVYFPVSGAMERHDARLRLPVYICTFQMLLTDVPSDAYGPSQYVAGSHYSGREPNDPYHPSFEGRGPVAVHGKAGDGYLHNGQCWHRGMPNTSERTRYLFQNSYGRRWIQQRFYPFVNYRLPQRVLDQAAGNERMLRVLGKHPKGPYG